MFDLSARLRELEEEYDKKVEDAKKEHALLSTVPEPLRRYKVHVHVYSLYGRECTIAFENVRYAASFADKSLVPLRPASLLEVASHYTPPLAVMKVNDGSTSFRPAFWVAAEQERKDNNWQLESVAPFTVRLRPQGHTQTCDVEWYHRTAAGRVVGVQVRFPLHAVWNAFGIVHGRAERRGDTIVGWSNVQWNCPAALRTGFGEPLAVRWAAGGKGELNEYTLYWPDPGMSLIHLAEFLKETYEPDKTGPAGGPPGGSAARPAGGTGPEA